MSDLQVAQGGDDLFVAAAFFTSDLTALRGGRDARFKKLQAHAHRSVVLLRRLAEERLTVDILTPEMDAFSEEWDAFVAAEELAEDRKLRSVREARLVLEGEGPKKLSRELRRVGLRTLADAHDAALAAAVARARELEASLAFIAGRPNYIELGFDPFPTPSPGAHLRGRIESGADLFKDDDA